MTWLDRSIFDEGKPFPFSVSILSWAYNEEENIEEFLLRSKVLMDSLGVEYEHILIDDCSRDGTSQVAKEFQSRYPQLKIIRNERNMNSGWNTRIAVAAASKDILFWQTVDWSYDISRIKEHLWSLRDYDVVQGVRRGGIGRRSDTFIKGVVSYINYRLIRILFRIPIGDFQNVTIYPRKLAQSIDFETHSAFTNPEMILKSYWKGAAFKQVSIDFIPRRKGEAKGTKPKFMIRSIVEIFRCWILWIVLGRRRDLGKGSVSGC